MQIKFIGTGGAFDYKYGNSSAWITYKDAHILIDCGYSVYPRLQEKDLIRKINYILITHLHDDHAGSLATMILHHKHVCRSTKNLVVLYPTEAFKDDISAFLSYSLIDPDEYLIFQSLDEVEGIGALDTTNLHATGMKSFAYYFQEEDDLLLYSGDIGQPDILFDFLKTQKYSNIRVFHEMCFKKMDGVHTYYKDLLPYFKEYQIFGYHFNPTNNPADNPIPLVYNHPEFLL